MGLADAIHPAAVAGPCIAGELAQRVETCVLLTGRDAGVLERLAGLMHTPYYHLWTSTDVAGVEACAALKNAYALGPALALGLHEQRGGQPGSVAMHNHEAAVFAQAIREMQRTVTLLGGDPETAHDSPLSVSGASSTSLPSATSSSRANRARAASR